MADICARKPDKTRQIDDTTTVQIYVDVPDTDAAPLIMCHRGDPDYWDDDVSTGSTDKLCTVLIYYRTGEKSAKKKGSKKKASKKKAGKKKKGKKKPTRENT